MTEFELLLPTIISQIETCTLSNPKKDVKYLKITIRRNKECNAAKENCFFIERFTQKQAFQKSLTETETANLLLLETGIHYKNVAIFTETEFITVLTNKRGKQTLLRKPIKKRESTIPSSSQAANCCCKTSTPHNKKSTTF
ncbi:MAG: hypothetical protein BKP49_06855 [Treponema sp. CETP13]|nr:MAG: hypothetical protein BKP49_06855 [Treponema sp. CETP13]